MKPNKKFWAALVLFGLIGQVAWVVENMYLNVFLYKMFHASAADISLMVGASAVAATLTTIVMGALTDRIGKRKVFICGGYFVWGVTILLFAFLRMDMLTPRCATVAEAAALGVFLTILLDCVMTFFGSTANDAAYNAWLTEAGDATNRGKIEGINAMMPLVAILAVFGGFMGFDLEQPDSWSLIYIIIGGVVLCVGIAGLFLIEETKAAAGEKSSSFLSQILYSFRFRTMKENPFLYAVIGAFALFGISIQIFMPYLILYYEKSLQMDNYVLIMAPAIVLASVVTAFYGRVYDMLGFQKSVLPSMIMLMGGYVVLYVSRGSVPVFLGSLFMMCGYLTGMAVFGALIRERIPEGMAGRFQGIRIIGQVLVPGVIGPAIGAFLLRDAEQIVNQDGTASFLPNRAIWSGAFVAGVLVLVALTGIFAMMRKGHYKLCSEAAEDGRQKNGWDGYPRPQLKRDNYFVIKEGWMLNEKDICVPFPPESLLSGYEGKLTKEMTYEVRFKYPKNLTKARTVLHFGAIDQVADVWLNGSFLDRHEGGYLGFSVDVTDFISKRWENRVVIKVTDKLSKQLPYGKQRKKRGGMWYTPVSGIWQPVWLESVPELHVDKVRFTPDTEGVEINATVHSQTALVRKPVQVKIALENGEFIEKELKDGKGYVSLAEHRLKDGSGYSPKLWSPEHPHLYTIWLSCGEDVVESYFALRKTEIKEIDGIQRVCLNNEPIFLHGVLDQGYYCDGIYLPAEAKEYERDILRMKELGFNLLRKHIKVEPECFYYYCDKHGMLVLQDMINNGSYSFLRDTALPTIGMKKRKDTGTGGKKRKEAFKEHTKQLIAQLYNHPSVVAYTVFNEGWGQFDADAMYDYVKSLDGTRLIDTTSGWFWQEKSDFDSEHIYFKAVRLTVKERPLFVSECGGYSRVIKNHHYSRYNTYGYGSAESEEELTERIVQMYEKMIVPDVENGICGCVYTQLSDVEDEVNGLYTYDRKVCKVEKERLQELAKKLRC